MFSMSYYYPLYSRELSPELPKLLIFTITLPAFDNRVITDYLTKLPGNQLDIFSYLTLPGIFC